MGTPKVVGISFYTVENLPQPLAEEATKQGFDQEAGIIAVKTRIGSPPSYIFETVGSSPGEIRAYIAQLALDDGTDINEALMRAFKERAE
jgi:hypothetical protein